MSADQSVEIHVPADLPVVDARRQTVHAVAMATDKLLTQSKNNPDGLIITVHIDSSGTYPSFVVTGTVPNSEPVKIVR